MHQFRAFPQTGFTLWKFKKNVLTLLENKKLVHGDIVFFNEKKIIQEQRRFSLREALDQADLDREFSLVYQPKINLNDKSVKGAEVLLRWEREGFGPVSPEDFIPIAEESGMIRTITHWVIETAFKNIAESQYDDLIFAINLSVLDLKGEDLLPFLRKTLKTNGISPEQIEFEVTEGIQVDFDPQIKRTFQELYNMGFRLAIDDFGTGYSSLSYLHRLKINNLKIDKSFVQIVTEENQKYHIINAIISMDLEITAEGVETEVQAEYLKKRGFDFAQGWFYSKGISWADFQSYRKKRKD